jgi:hypothetical protein
MPQSSAGEVGEAEAPHLCSSRSTNRANWTDSAMVAVSFGLGLIGSPLNAAATSQSLVISITDRS